MGGVSRFPARGAGATLCWRDWEWRSTRAVFCLWVYGASAAVGRPLFSLGLFSGSPGARLALGKKAAAASRARLGVNRKAIVGPAWATARYHEAPGP